MAALRSVKDFVGKVTTKKKRIVPGLCHRGTQADGIVMTARAAELLAMMPDKPPPDLSQLLLSPMPGLLAEVAVEVGQEVRAGETLVVIEAMKMQNSIKAETECVVAELLARPGDSLSVDQPILRFASS